MDVSLAFHEALKDVERCHSAEIKRLRDENLRLSQLLAKAQNGQISLEIPPQPEAEPINLIEISPQQTVDHPVSLNSQASTAAITDDSLPMNNKVTHKLDEDAMAIKQLFKQRTQTKPDVEETTDLYYETGLFQWVAKSSAFEYLTLSVVVLNGFWIAIDVDLNTGGGETVWVVMDNFFCTYFSIELFIRFGAFQRKWKVLCDRWFMFDLCLVAMMVVETWVLPLYSWISGTEGGDGGNAQVLRLLRLMRLSRMAKMMRSLPELAILIKGTVVGIRGVSITLVLLGGITFVFAIAMRTLTDGTEVGSESFHSVPSSAYTLLIQGVIPDNGDLMTALMVTKWYYGVLFFLFIFLAALTFMNMLIGILCEAVHGVSCDEKEEMDIQNMKDLLNRLFSEHQEFHHTQMVTKHMFVMVMEEDKDIWDCLAKLDVDIPSLSDNITGIFDITESGAMEFDDFIDVILKFRATDQSMIKGIFDLRALVHDHFSAVQTRLDSIHTKVSVNADGSHGRQPRASRQCSLESILSHSSDSVMIELQKLENMLEPVSVVLKAMQPDGASQSDKIQRPRLSNGREASSSEEVAANLVRNQMTSGSNANRPDMSAPAPPTNTMPSSQSAPIQTGAPTTQAESAGPQEQPSASRASKPCNVTYNNGVQPAGIGATPVLSTQKNTFAVSSATETEEARPLLDFQAEQPAEVDRPPGTSATEPSQSNAPNPADPGADNTVSEILEHHAYFGEDVSALEFRVSWDTKQPIVLSVKPGGEAESRGLWAGDILSEINGTETLGKPRDELLPILTVRPLLLKCERHHERTPV